jgi:hypothetical protein
LNIPASSEYVHELAVHLAVLNGRGDLKVEHGGDPFRRQTEPVFVATPVMENQPSPSVRLGVFETGAKTWPNDLLARLGPRAHLVYRGTTRVRLLSTQIQKPMCPLLVMAGAYDGFFCAPGQRFFDKRRFVYGWEVYQADAV